MSLPPVFVGGFMSLPPVVCRRVHVLFLQLFVGGFMSLPPVVCSRVFVGGFMSSFCFFSSCL